MKKLALFILAISILSATTANASTLFPTGGGTGSTTLSGILIGNGTAPLNTLTIGTGLTLTGSTLTSSGGGATFGKTWEINGAGQLTPTTTVPVLISNAFTVLNPSTTRGDGTYLGTDATHGIKVGYYNANNYALWAGGVTPGPTNYGFLLSNDGTSAQFNSTNNVEFNISDATKLAINSSGQVTLASLTNGLVKSTSGLLSNAASGTDYAPATSGTSILYGNGAGGFSNATIGTGLSFIGGSLSATASAPPYDFPLTGNATSTLTQFNGGLTAYASSTIGNGTQANGLTISGGATTTGNAYFANGSAAAPSIAFSANPTTGFSNSAGTISISSAGTARLLIGSGLNFNSSSVTNGSIIQSGNAGGYQLFSGTGASVTAPILIPDRGDTTTGFAAGVAGNINAIIGGVEKVRWTSVGEGIGSSTPFFNLSIGSNNVGNFGISTTTAGAACFSSIGELYSGTCGGTTYTGSAPITVTGSIIGTSFSTSTFNSYTNQNVFTSIFATLASSTNSTTTNLAIVGNASNCGGTSALTTNSSGVVGCTAQPQGTVTSITATYPILSSGGATPVLSTAFGTTTNWGLGSNGLVIVGSSGIPSVVASSSLNLPNTALQNSSITVNGSSISLGGSATVTANTTNALTFNNSGSGAASGTTFNGGSAQTISYNTIGAQVAGTYVTSVGGTGVVSSSGGTTPNLTVTGGSNGQILSWLSGVPTWTATTTFSSPLLYSGGNVTCQTASGSLNGCLSSTDWTTFNNKGIGTVTSVGLSDSNSTLTIGSTPVTTSGTITATLNLAHANTWTTTQTFNGAGNSAIFGNNVGIGTTTPYSNYQVEVASSTGQQLVFSDASKTSDQWAFRNSGGVLNIGTSSPLTGATSTTQSAVQISSNNGTLLGIATTTPWRTLSVTGTVGFDGLTAAFGTVQGICYETATKEIVVNSLASCVTSSKRWKTDIDYSDTPDLQTFMQLKPVTFTRIDSHLKQIGFIAEDIAALDPRLAGYDGQGLPSSIDDTGILAITVKAVQQQQAEIISIGKGMKDNAEDNWQWVAIGLLIVWNTMLTVRRKK